MTNENQMITTDELQRMPWTRGLMTPEQATAWMASRKEAGESIDIETCELGRWHEYECEPYGILELPEAMRQIGTCRFVRSPESAGWINETDLPDEKVGAMYDRIERESRSWHFRELLTLIERHVQQNPDRDALVLLQRAQLFAAQFKIAREEALKADSNTIGARPRPGVTSQSNVRHTHD
jgi:hypothetical protein